MAETVTIPRRFNGPPDFGRGRYSCGVVAALVDAPSASVSLRPVPLDTQLVVRRGDAGMAPRPRDARGEGRPGALTA